MVEFSRMKKSFLFGLGPHLTEKFSLYAAFKMAEPGPAGTDQVLDRKKHPRAITPFEWLRAAAQKKRF